jgi:hypothetical protein
VTASPFAARMARPAHLLRILLQHGAERLDPGGQAETLETRGSGHPLWFFNKVSQREPLTYLLATTVSLAPISVSTFKTSPPAQTHSPFASSNTRSFGFLESAFVTMQIR